MTLNDFLAIVVIGGITIFGLIMLWVIVRFAIISPMRTRGADRRLRKPEPEKVEAKWRIKLPPALPRLFREQRGRATSVANTNALGRPRRSVRFEYGWIYEPRQTQPERVHGVGR